jgi:hypothetical protein
MNKLYCKTVYHDEVVMKFTKYTTFDKLFGKKWAKAVNKMMIKRNKHVQQGNIHQILSLLIFLNRTGSESGGPEEEAGVS